MACSLSLIISLSYYNDIKIKLNKVPTRTPHNNKIWGDINSFR